MRNATRWIVPACALSALVLSLAACGLTPLQEYEYMKQKYGDSLPGIYFENFENGGGALPNQYYVDISSIRGPTDATVVAGGCPDGSFCLMMDYTGASSTQLSISLTSPSDQTFYFWAYCNNNWFNVTIDDGGSGTDLQLDYSTPTVYWDQIGEYATRYVLTFPTGTHTLTIGGNGSTLYLDNLSLGTPQ